jgi:hypothetical protein
VKSTGPSLNGLAPDVQYPLFCQGSLTVERSQDTKRNHAYSRSIGEVDGGAGKMAQNKLTALQIKAAPDGKLFDGSGHTLVKKAGGGYWVHRYSLGGEMRKMGLGPFPDVGLADARKVRDAWAAVLASGRDPLSEREAKRAQDALDRDQHDPTFEEMTMIDAKRRPSAAKA